MTPRQADRVYLGWEYAVLHPHPGPRPGGPYRPARSGWIPAGCWPSSGRNAGSACR